MMADHNNNSGDGSRLNRLIFFLICSIPIFSAVAFGAVDSWALGMLSVIMAFILALWCADSLGAKQFILSLSPLQLPILGLIIIGLIQLLPVGSTPPGNLSIPAVNSLSVAPYSTRIAIIQLCVYLVFFALAYVVINCEKRVRKLVYTVIVFGAIIGFFGILQRLGSPDDLIYGLRPAFQAKPFASFVNQHHFAAFMEMTIAFPLALLFGQATKKDKRALLIIAAVVMGMAILFTSSRAGLLSLLGVVGFIVIANLISKRSDSGNPSDADKAGNLRRKFALLCGGMAIIIVIFGIVIYLTDDSTIDRVLTMQTQNQEFGSGRSHFWTVAWQIFKDYPLIGSGLDSFGIAFPAYDTWNGQFRLEYAHNDYLQILSDAGILGFLCVVSFVYLLFKRSFRVIAESESRFLRNVAIGALAGCFGILIHSFFDFPLRTPSNSYFFLLFAVLATTSVKASRKRLKSDAGEKRRT